MKKYKYINLSQFLYSYIFIVFIICCKMQVLIVMIIYMDRQSWIVSVQPIYDSYSILMNV